MKPESPSGSPQTGASGRWSFLILGLLYPTLLTWVYFRLLAGSSTRIQQQAYSAGKAIQFALPVVWWFWILRGSKSTRGAEGVSPQFAPRASQNGDRPLPGERSRGSLRFSLPRIGAVVWGLASGLLIAGAMFGAYRLVAARPELATASSAVRERLSAIGVSNRSAFVLLGLFYAAIHSALEEFYWRWFVFAVRRELSPPWAALGISSLGFMAHHVIVLLTYFSVHWALALSVAVAFAGGFWAWLYQHSGSLYAPWLSHLLADAAIFAVGYQMVFG